MPSSPKFNASPETDQSPVAYPTVESFSFTLNGWEQILAAESPARWLEAQLLARLGRPIRLLRWAIVQVDQPSKDKGQKVRLGRFRCEGAYLRRPAKTKV